MVSADQVAFLAAEDLSSPATLLVSVEQVTNLAGVTVGDATIRQAQLMVTTASGVDLGDAAAVAALAAADQRHLALSVVWQCVYLSAHPEAFAGTPGNIVSATANGASVTYRDGGSGEVDLSPLALRELDACSWRSQTVTVRTLRPYLRAQTFRGPQPDPWRPL